MGLFDDFDIDMDEVKAAGGFDFEDGHYTFELSEALKQQGSKNNPDNTYLILKYDLNDGEAGTYWEWFTIAVDGDSEHPDAKRSLGYLKNRLLDLGIPASELNTIEPEDLEGIAGTLELKTTSGKGKNSSNTYQNVRNVKVGAAEKPEEEPEQETTAATKQRVAAKRAAREAAAKPAPARKPVAKRAAPAAEEDTDEDNPFAD